jgi:charged multivesicular body protein 1
MASRIDACSSRIETAVRMGQVTSSMKGVTKGMEKSLASMDINQISTLMDKFEQQFEDLDVKVNYVAGMLLCLYVTLIFYSPLSTSKRRNIWRVV